MRQTGRQNLWTEKKTTFIVRCGEVALKGMNKPYFERVLLERIRKNLKKYDGVEAERRERSDFREGAGRL